MRTGRPSEGRASLDRPRAKVTCGCPLYRRRPQFALPEVARRHRGRRKYSPETADAESPVEPHSSIAARPCREVERIGFAWLSTELGQASRGEEQCRRQTTPSCRV